MQLRKCRRGQRVLLAELGVASSDTLGLPVAEVPEPMGFWRKNGISDQ